MLQCVAWSEKLDLIADKIIFALRLGCLSAFVIIFVKVILKRSVYVNKPLRFR